MKVSSRKGYQLKYEITEKKLRNAVIKVIEAGKDPTVKMVAKEAGVSISTAYAHKCPDMILNELMK